MKVKQMRANARAAGCLLKALANENRLLILCQLAEGEKNVGELEAALDIRQPTLSQQLARLREDGLVATRRVSKSIYYRLASSEAARIVDLLYEMFCERTGEAEDVVFMASRDVPPDEPLGVITMEPHSAD